MASIVALFVGAAAASALLWAARGRARKGWARLGALLILTGTPALVFWATGAPLSFSVPELAGFNFRGGVAVNPEFLALLAGLSLYTGAFIAEVVRGGILAVNRGQVEAAGALGLQSGATLRLVVVPQAIRAIVPPLTNQYLNLIKNSSLAVAVGYPDLVSVFSGTVLSQTGQAIEVVAMMMAVYLTLSLLTSLFMNWFNARRALVER
jgi:general L-amino acid transport system permease protein